jgi:hypothetical protein
MQTDGFKIVQMRKNIQNENSFNRWLNSLENQLEQKQKLRDERRAAFMKTLPPTKSRASPNSMTHKTRSNSMTRKTRSNSMPRYKSRSSTRSKTRSKPYSVERYSQNDKCIVLISLTLWIQICRKCGLMMQHVCCFVDMLDILGFLKYMFERYSFNSY